jgi:hypothetical protein
MKLTLTSRLRLLAAFFFAFAILAIIVSFAVTAQVTPVEHALQTGERAYAELKAADEAGANITALASQYNSALGMLDNATRLEKSGDNATTSALASQAENQFQAVIQQAQSLRDAAMVKREKDARLQTYAPPIGALIVAFAAVAILLIYRKVRSRQFGELKVRLKGDVRDLSSLT